jgi:hypothetical protein
MGQHPPRGHLEARPVVALQGREAMEHPQGQMGRDGPVAGQTHDQSQARDLSSCKNGWHQGAPLLDDGDPPPPAPPAQRKGGPLAHCPPRPVPERPPHPRPRPAPLTKAPPPRPHSAKSPYPTGPRIGPSPELPPLAAPDHRPQEPPERTPRLGTRPAHEGHGNRGPPSPRPPHTLPNRHQTRAPRPACPMPPAPGRQIPGPRPRARPRHAAPDRPFRASPPVPLPPVLVRQGLCRGHARQAPPRVESHHRPRPAVAQLHQAPRL